jgi:hypothetical protein
LLDVAEHRGAVSPDGLQHLLARASWDADAVRDDLPADPDDVVGTFPASGPADVRAAVDALDKAAPEWRPLRPSGAPRSWNPRRHSWNLARLS